MTRTGPADAVMPARSHAAPGRTVLAQPGCHDLVSVRLASRVPVSVGAVFPGPASFKHASGRLAGRSGRPRSACPPLRQQRARAPHPPGSRSPTLADPLYSYLLKRHAAPLFGCSFDPGRDTLCILTSPPRWLQWP